MDAITAEKRIQPVRRVSLQVSINGHDAASAIDPALLDFKFTDNASGKADEIRLSLHDRDGKWHGDWRPALGMDVTATLVARDWEQEGVDLSLPCGTFRIDELEFSGPPDKVDIKAVSSALTTGLRDEKKTQAWESFSLRKLAGDVAGRNGLELMYDGPEHTFSRQDQREESDLAFLQRLSTERGMNCKVHDGKLILFDGAGADGRGASLTIPRKGSLYSPTSYRFRESSSGTGYSKAKVAYTDPTSGTTHEAEVSAPKENVQPDEKTLQLNKRVESSAEAIRLGKSGLRQTNKNKDKATIEIMGNPGLVAGIVIGLTGFGKLDGSYFVEKAEHAVSSSGYRTSAEIRRTLSY
ncbi:MULTISPECIES: phage late control D family protein [Pseudomonadati]|jgi:phage protein D|uniref:phage late control D family protein n=1 Tax=Pseudomonadati TaxID=3379134 RepID=UPI002666CBF5|nr:contractile injection system protein, VgrG/Pvc8 family [Bilophila wadsworthia]